MKVRFLAQNFQMKIETTEIQVKIERYSEKLNDSMKFEDARRAS
jgi:hypothetical protein